MEVVNHHSGLLRYGIAVALHKIAEFLLGALFVKHRIVLDSLHQSVKAVNRRVIPQHIQNESLLDSLLHRVDMEWLMLQFALIIQYRIPIFIHNKYAEGLQRLVLWCSCEGKIAGIIQQLTPFHHSVDFILVVHLII